MAVKKNHENINMMMYILRKNTSYYSTVIWIKDMVQTYPGGSCVGCKCAHLIL